MNTTPAPASGPAWWQSPKLLLPVALVAAVLLLTAFASVVEGIVHQGETGNGAPPVTSPGVDRV